MVSSRHILSLLATAGLGLATPTKPVAAWQDLGEIPDHPRQEHIVAVLNSTTIALVGGIRTAEVPRKVPPITTDIVQFYNSKTGQWTYGPALPFTVNHPNAIGAEGKLFFFGGLVEVYPSYDWVAAPDSYVLDLKGKGGGEAATWKKITPVPEGFQRGSGQLAYHKGRIYMAGGLKIRTQTLQDTIDTVVAYDIKTDTWHTANGTAKCSLPAAAAKMPEGRDHASSAVVDGVFYILGGRAFGRANVKDTVFALDLDRLDKGWVIKKGKLPTARGGLSAGAVGSKIYTFGGEGNYRPGEEFRNGVFAEAEAYDTRKDSWERLANMSMPRHGTWGVALNGGVYLAGGGPKEGAYPLRKFDVYIP